MHVHGTERAALTFHGCVVVSEQQYCILELIQLNLRGLEHPDPLIAACPYGYMQSTLGLVTNLHDGDVVVGQHANVVLYPPVLCYGRLLLLPLLPPMVRDVPQLITQILEGGGLAVSLFHPCPGF